MKRQPGNYSLDCAECMSADTDGTLSNGGNNLASMSEVRDAIRTHRVSFPTHTKYYANEMFTIE